MGHIYRSWENPGRCVLFFINRQKTMPLHPHLFSRPNIYLRLDPSRSPSVTFLPRCAMRCQRNEVKRVDCFVNWFPDECTGKE